MNKFIFTVLLVIISYIYMHLLGRNLIVLIIRGCQGPAVKTNILTIYNRGNYIACEMGDQRIDIRRDKIIIYVPGLKASNEETYRQYAINNIGVLNYIYNCKKY